MFDSVSETDPLSSDVSDQRSPGERLRLAREARGETIKDVAARTHQSVDTLRALEAMQTDGLSATIIRMHAARYAKAINLPGEELADAYASAREMMSLETRGANPVQSLVKRSHGPAIAIGAFALGLACVGLISGLRGPKPSLENVPISTRALAQQSAGTETYRHAATLSQFRGEVALRAKRKAWIEVRASDGTIFRSRDMSAGEIYYPRLDAGWTVTVRDASAFEIMLDGQGVMTMGDASPGYSVSVDQMAARASLHLEQQTAGNQQTTSWQNR